MRNRKIISLALALVLMFPIGSAIPTASAAEDTAGFDATAVTDTQTDTTGTTDSASASQTTDTTDASASDTEAAEAATTDATGDTTTAGTAATAAAAGEATTDAATTDATSIDSSAIDTSLLTSYSASALLPAAAKTTTVVRFSGSSRLDTSAMQAKYAFSSSEYIIITSSLSAPDALSAAGLAGALNCPILLTDPSTLASTTSEAISSLGVKKAIIIGSTNSVSAGVQTSIASLIGGAGNVTRLSGSDRFETQLSIYRYGLDNSLWSSDMLIVTSGITYTDALSISPVAFSKKCPVFLTNANGEFSDNQMTALVAGATDDKLFKQTVITGGTDRVTTLTEGYLWGISQISSGKYKNVIRLAGANRYATSGTIAEWAVNSGYLVWDNVAFATGNSFADALGGGVMQGKQGSVLLLVDSQTDASMTTLANHSDEISTTIRFFGGLNSLSQDLRSYICALIDIADISYASYDITLTDMATLEDAADNASYNYKTYAEFYNALNPDEYSFGDDDFYQFAVLNDGYSGAVSAAQLNALIDSKATSVENGGGYAAKGATNGVYSTMRGQGQAFIDAAKTYNVNEVYLVALAGLESAWGCSTLACGQVYTNGVTYYNFFGIGATDGQANSAGLARAAKEGWSSPYLAILGGGQWISSNYLNNSYGPQNTFYKMKWDLYHATNDGSVWHQYCTGSTWQLMNAENMARIYEYLGMNMSQTGLHFEVPVYSGA